MLFGPAYKGIPLAAAHRDRAGAPRPQLALRLQSQGSQGSRRRRQLVGAPLAGRVLIIDDVISAGTSVRESVDLIRAAGATPGRRGHRAGPPGAWAGRLSAVQEVERDYGIPVIAVAGLRDLMDYLEYHPESRHTSTAVERYREQYGVSQ